MDQLRTIFALMSGERELSDDEIAKVRLDLEAALDSLRRAREASAAISVDLDAIRRALASAERQLGRARMRCERASGGARRG